MVDSTDKHLEDIKRLLVLLLLKLDATSDEIAIALQVHSATVRKMMPGTKIKKLVRTAA